MSFVAFKIFSLSLTFFTLIMMFLGVGLFGFILFGFFCAFWTCMSVCFTRLEKVSVIIFQIVFQQLSLSLLLPTPHDANVGVLEGVPEASPFYFLLGRFPNVQKWGCDGPLFPAVTQLSTLVLISLSAPHTFPLVPSPHIICFKYSKANPTYYFTYVCTSKNNVFQQTHSTIIPPTKLLFLYLPIPRFCSVFPVVSNVFLELVCQN